MFEGQPWHEVWAYLESEQGGGWRTEQGPRGKTFQTYYLPAGVSRCKGFRNRVDYFDSKTLVLRHLSGELEAGKGAKKESKAPDVVKATKGKAKKEKAKDIKDDTAQEVVEDPAPAPTQSMETERAGGATSAGARQLQESGDVPQTSGDAPQTQSSSSASPVAAASSDSDSSSSSDSDASVMATPRQSELQEEALDAAGTAQLRSTTKEEIEKLQPQPQDPQESHTPGKSAAATSPAKPVQAPEAKLCPIEKISKIAAGDLGAEVKLLKALIEAPFAPEMDVLATFKRLQALGSLSVDVFRTTRIGKAVNRLLKRTRSRAIRTRARALLSTWKEFVYQTEGQAETSLETPAAILFTTPKKQTAAPQDSSPDEDHGARVKRRKLDEAQNDSPKERRRPNVDTTNKFTDTRPHASVQRKSRAVGPAKVYFSELARTESSCSADANDCAIMNAVPERDGSNDFVLQLDSGEEVLLQCNLDDCMSSLQDICSTSGRDWVSDDKVSEGATFWNDLCALASDITSMNNSGLDAAWGECLAMPEC